MRQKEFYKITIFWIVATTINFFFEKELFVNKVYIVLNDNYTASPELESKIFELFKQPTVNSVGEEAQLKTYEIPKYIEFVADLPRKKGTDKIDYQLLTEEAKKYVLKR